MRLWIRRHKDVGGVEGEVESAPESFDRWEVVRAGPTFRAECSMPRVMRRCRTADFTESTDVRAAMSEVRRSASDAAAPVSPLFGGSSLPPRMRRRAVAGQCGYVALPNLATGTFLSTVSSRHRARIRSISFSVSAVR